jgi:hypothetical protein
MHKAARQGARRLLARTVLDKEGQTVRLYFYHDGEPFPEEKWEEMLRQGIGSDGQGFGLADARYIVETLNGGCLRSEPSDLEGYSDLFTIELQAERDSTEASNVKGGHCDREAGFPS